MMNCLDCEYDLRGLPAGSCPECGRAFDPLDPSSFRPGNSRSPRLPMHLALLIVIASSLVPVLHVVSGHLALVAARLSLGHWPHRFGRDDPKYIGGGVGFLHSVWMILTVLLIPAIVAWLVFAAAAMFPRRDVDGESELSLFRKPIVAITFFTWIAAIPIIFLDPAKVGVWMFD